MSHDADKLIRQLSLVAFLMAERRPLTARDVKGNVEGYSEMSDEAFARRFYSDRAELTALGVPLNSQRDEFTGEELYTLRSENYFLDRLDLDDDELAALQTALYALEGKFAYAEPLRLALQNLALGRPGFQARADRDRRARPRQAPDYSPELAGRLSKLESAISKQRTIQFRYWSPARDRETERRLNPYALRLDEGVWYVVGQDLDRDAIRTFRVSRIRSDIRFATRRERDFRLPAEFNVDAHRVPRPWQIGETVGVARIAVQGDTAWWVERTLADAGAVVDGVFETGYRAPRATRVVGPAPERQGSAARARSSFSTRARRRSTCCASAHKGDGARDGARASTSTRAAAVERSPSGRSRPSASASSRRCSRTCSPRAARSASAQLDADDLAARFSIPREELQEHPLAPQPRQLRRRLLHGLRRGGRGHGRRPHRQGALRRRLPQAAEADAARGPGDPARDRVRRPDDRRRGRHAARARAPQARGDLRPVRARPRPDARAATTRRRSCATLSDGAEKRRVVEIEYLKEGEESRRRRAGRAVHHRAGAAVLARAHLGPDGRTGRARTGSTACARRVSPARLRAARGLRPELPAPSPPGAGSGTRPWSRAGSSSAARARSPTRQRSPT